MVLSQDVPVQTVLPETGRTAQAGVREQYQATTAAAEPISTIVVLIHEEVRTAEVQQEVRTGERIGVRRQGDPTIRDHRADREIRVTVPDALPSPEVRVIVRADPHLLVAQATAQVEAVRLGAQASAVLAAVAHEAPEVSEVQVAVAVPVLQE